MSWPSAHEGAVEVGETANWRLRFGPQDITVRDAQDAVVQTVAKERIVEDLGFNPVFRALIVTSGGTKELVKLSEEQAAAIVRLLGVAEWEARIGEKESRAMLVIGAILVAFVALDVGNGGQRGVLVVAGQAMWGAAGLLMLVNGWLARRRMRARNHLLHLVSTLVVLGCIAVTLVTAFSWFMLAASLLLPLAALYSYQCYRFYSRLESAEPVSQQPPAAR